MKLIWLPQESQISKTHIAQWMKEKNFSSYEQLHRWSVANYKDFWKEFIEKSGIQFKKKYSAIVDLSAGVEAPQWLPGAELNIADSCFLAEESKTAILYQDYTSSEIKKLSYSELNKRSNQVADALVRLGIKPGDAIGIDIPMTIESVMIYLGVLKAGAAAISIADSFSEQEIELRLKIAQAKLVFTQDFIPRAGKKIPLYEKVKAATVQKIIVVPHEKALSIELRPQDLEWSDFLKNSSAQFKSVSCAPEAVLNILFSSGTTGDPKAIPWTQTTPLKCAMDAYFHHDVHPEDVVAWPTSLGWMMGPWLIFASLLNRSTMALCYEAPVGKTFGEFIQNAKVTVLGVVPSMVKTWRQTACMEGLNWSALKTFSSTGECSSPDDYVYLSQLAGQKPIIEYCGGTEIGGGYITSTLVQKNYASGFTTASLGLDFVILDEEGKSEVEEGEVFLVPPSIGLSTRLLNHDHHKVYYKDTPKIKDQTLRRHGDRIHKMGPGQYMMMGRADDTMNLGGIKVSSAEIERVLNLVPNVLETAAVAIPPEGGGPDQLIVFTVLKKETDLSLLKNLFRDEIKHKLNPLFKVHDVVILEKLPRTASNKILRRNLRKEYHAT